LLLYLKIPNRDFGPKGMFNRLPIACLRRTKFISAEQTAQSHISVNRQQRRSVDFQGIPLCFIDQDMDFL
jgi:hypothetical protein